LSENDIHNADSSTNSPGIILKRCREYHGMSLDEAATATKIGASYLQALEDDQIGEFANLAYLKGFLRIYATHLGLNPDDMIRLYERRHAAAATQKGNTSGPGSTSPAQRRRIPWQRLILPSILLLLLIVSSAILNRSSGPPRQPVALPQPSPAAAPVQAVQHVSSSVHAASPVTKKTETGTVQAQSPTSEEPAAPEQKNSIQAPHQEVTKGFVVRLKVTQNGNLGVSIDGAPSQTYDLTGGDIFEWKAEKSIALELSNAGGVSAELGGKPLKPFGAAGTPAYIVLDAHGVKQ